MTTIDPSAPVLVTGGSGYIASWIVRYLLEDGHSVRATVRDPEKAHGLEHLHALAARHPGQLSLHRADLLEPGSFSEAMQGCQLVIHTASPFLLGTIGDADRQLVRPALEGTRNVLSAVDQTPSVARVVLTSSVAAIYGDNADMKGKTCFTEADWNTTSTPEHQPYPYSKTVAERAAWQIQQSQKRWDLVTIHPSLVLGPSLTTASASGSMDTMQHFIDMSMALGAPALQMGCVDVRDVARAHITAGYTPGAQGRYVVNSEVVSMLELSRMLRRHFGSRLSFPTRELPKFMVKLVAPVAGLTRPFVERNIDWPLCLDGSRARTELAIDFRPVADSVVEHFQQMIDDGVARR
ncbi:NAD-dependent epimerase/dehydratase family protein [[Mycobacterium] holstebronense]|uniref:NAD-dependent epimerase/dehydratase family protein n=1 Tax=[Mycobacterium] holstebronense TaxID=3064288 RepID=A0ABN9NAD7_9MYCO|nr:NAD-dependent epimerase/dehydratase family protein [Mycolicibacter sp. MU0102]CAJ1501417.1 NAD-dependent epimerase/dehydratase family protein [Mycolicibacter sp. MU0102]